MDLRIAVVGAGFSGLLVAVQLSRRLPDARIALIEKAPRFAEGAAYATRNADHLLNVRLTNMSVFPDDPDHLRRWLATQSSWSSQGAFITRGDYGRYLRSILAEALEGRDGGLHLIHDEVVHLAKDGAEWCVTFSGRDPLFVDVVVLALGNLEPARPTGISDAVAASDRYIADPWRPKTQLAADARRILLIGSSLTMIDVVLAEARPGRRFTALSRRGLAPRAHASSELALASTGYAGSPFEVLRKVRKTALSSDWRAVTDDVRRSAQSLWRSWSAEQRRQFLRHLRPIWDVHRHRLAPAVANRMQSMIASGELTIEAGRILNITPVGKRLVVSWRGRGDLRARQMTVDAVINCTGPLADAASSEIGAIRSLRDARRLRPDANGLGLDVAADSRVRDADGAPQDDLYAVGPITRGAFWEITAVPDIRAQAVEIADAIQRHGAEVGR